MVALSRKVGERDSYAPRGTNRVVFTRNPGALPERYLSVRVKAREST